MLEMCPLTQPVTLVDSFKFNPNEMSLGSAQGIAHSVLETVTQGSLTPFWMSHRVPPPREAREPRTDPALK